MMLKMLKPRVASMTLLCTMMFGGLPSAAQNTAAQGNNITVRYDKKSLQTLLDEVERQSGYYRMQYVVDDVAPYTISGNIDGLSAADAVRRLLSGTPLKMEVNGHFIHVFNPQKTYTQQGASGRTVKGRVFDKNGETLIGVTVRDRQTGAATVTNLDGEFTLPVAAKGDYSTLTLSYIGKKDTEVRASHRKPANIVMDDDDKMLADVVVTGYQTLSKERVTGSFDKVGQEVLANRPTSDLSSALQGLVAGMQATENQDGSVDFLIRGTSSLYANTQPLIVVDGFPIEGTFSSINPNDVESVTVLKDAAAASIWGARSANGVIVVTTKKGQKGKLRVDAQAFYRINTSPDLDYMLAQADSRTTVDYELLALKNEWSLSPFSNSIWNITSPLSMVQEYYYANKYFGMSDGEMNQNLDRLRATNNRDQIKKYLLQTQALQQYNISLSAGSNKHSTYASVLYEKNDEATVKNGYERFILNFNNSYKFNSWLTGTLSGNFQRKQQQSGGPTYSEIASLSPYEMLVNADGSYAKNIGSWNTLIAENYPLQNLPYKDMSYNLLREVRGRNKKTETTSYRVNIGLNAKVWRNLVFDTKLQYERNQSDVREYYSDDTEYVRYMVNYYTEYDLNNDKLLTQYIPKGGIIKPAKSSNENYVWRNQLSYNETFGKHDVSALAGMEISQYKTSSTTYPYVLGYDPDKNTSQPAYYGSQTLANTLIGYPDYEGTLSSMVKNVFSDRKDKYASFFGNFGYIYDSRYGVSFSVRSDGSNFVTQDKSLRWSPMWSLGGRWNASNESFMKGTRSWLDRLTLRLTYGINGNAEKSTSPQTLISTKVSSITGTNVSNISSYGNPLLRWEETYTTNLGVDFSLFGGTLSGKIDYYDRLGKYIVGTVTVPSVYGSTTQRYNNAEIQNRGIETELTGHFRIRPADIDISSTVTFSYNDNKVKKLFYPDLYCNVLAEGTFVEGKPVGAIYSYEYAGMQDGVPRVKTKDGTVWRFDDLMLHNRTLGLDKMTYSGTTVSPCTFGWANRFEWKGIALYVFLTGKFGGVFRRPGVDNVPLTDSKAFISKYITELMQSDGTTSPALPQVGDFMCYRWGRYLPNLQSNIENASFIRLKEVNLSYTVPAYLLRRFHLQGLKVFAQARDLGLLYTANSKGYDPEWLPGSLYKPSASVMFGLSISF